MANNLRLYALIFLVIILVACGQAETNETVVGETETAVSVPPTSLSLSPTPTRTPSATAITIPTQTPTPSATATATTIPTLTPLPTFAPEELETAVAELLANPMNCDVPCWWGAIPGVTSLDEIKNATSPFSFDVNEYVDGPDTILRLGIGYIEERNDFEFIIGYGFYDSILTTISADSPPISEIQAKYGLPDEVWFSAMNDPRQQPPLVWFTIVYLQEGIGIGYVVDGNVQGNMVIGCIANESTERLRELRLISPGIAVSYKDFPGTFDKERFYLSLEEATNLTTKEFMQQFSDPNQPQCIETPTELWE